MSDNVAELTVEYQETAGGIEEGDTLTGVITGTSIRETVIDGDEVEYYDVKIAEDQYGIDQTVGFTTTWSEGSHLGTVLRNFGASTEGGVQLHEIFAPGTAVEFEVVFDDAGPEVDRDYWINADKTTLRPKGSEAPIATSQPQTESGSSDEEPDVGNELRARVIEIIDDLDTDSEADIKAKLVDEDPELLRAYNQLQSDGVIAQ